MEVVVLFLNSDVVELELVVLLILSVNWGISALVYLT